MLESAFSVIDTMPWLAAGSVGSAAAAWLASNLPWIVFAAVAALVTTATTAGIVWCCQRRRQHQIKAAAMLKQQLMKG